MLRMLLFPCDWRLLGYVAGAVADARGLAGGNAVYPFYWRVTDDLAGSQSAGAGASLQPPRVIFSGCCGTIFRLTAAEREA
ncbi:MAG: hypothetical protein PsegKO_17740 [Pseudohongiellaceae bacterium]